MDIVIFGVSGDLAEKKLVPVLIHMYKTGKLPEDTRVIGFSRTFKHHDMPFYYEHIVGSYSNMDDFKKLYNALRHNKKQFFYLALPPDASRQVLESISKVNIVTKNDVGGNKVILVEKPFGRGFSDAKSIIEHINESFLPDQCLKVDHYAGKNELNRISSVTSTQIDKVTFEILEKHTVENRRGFYDTVGALRDIGQNHLLVMFSAFFKSIEGKQTREEIMKRLELSDNESEFKFGHYEGYDSIETFFYVPAILRGENPEDADCKIIFCSGKALSVNRAGIRVDNGSLQEYIELTPGLSAYENVFTNALEGRTAGFLSDMEVLLSWEFIEKVEKIKERAFAKGLFFSYPLGSDVDSFFMIK